MTGSFGRGTADEWSDVDFLAVVDPQDQAGFANRWREVLQAITPIVFWNEVNKGGLLLNAISHEWLRCDINIASPGLLGQRAKDRLKPLIDRDGIYQTLPDIMHPKTADAETVRYLINEFIRMLGLLPVCAERGEYVTLVLGVGMMRGLFQSLLMQDVTDPDPGGILHQSKVMPREHMEMLMSLPYPPPQRDAVIEANFEIARRFFPRARELALRLNIAWPEAFEAATRRRLISTLGEAAKNAW